MSTDLYILGAGGHAFDVADVAASLGYRAIFVAGRNEEIAAWHHPDPIISEAEAFAGPGRRYAIGVGDNRIRAQLAARVRHHGVFPPLIHPDTSFGRGTRAAAEQSIGTVILAGARFTNRISMGNFVTVNLGATVSHDVDLADYVTLAPGAHVAGNVQVGEGAWLGMGVAINQGISGRKRAIGAWTKIGSGAVVVADCESHSVYVGVPARKVS